MTDIKKIEYELFKMAPIGYYGILLRRSVMMKLTKLQNNYIQKAKELLNESKEEIIVTDWTMAWEEKTGSPAIYANFIRCPQEVSSAISSYAGLDQPEKVECYNTTDGEALTKKIYKEYLAQFEEEKQND